MISQKFRYMLLNVKYNGKIFLRNIPKVSSVYTTNINATGVHTICINNHTLKDVKYSQNRNVSSVPCDILIKCSSYDTVNSHSKCAKRLRLQGTPLCYNNNLLTKNSQFYYKSTNATTVRHYTDFKDLNVAFPSPFNNGFAKTIAESSAVEFLMDKFLWLHDVTGLSWACSILIMTLVARTLVFPFAILQQRNTAKLENLKSELESLHNDVQLKIMNSLEKKRLQHHNVEFLFRKTLKEEYDKLIIRENCHPLRGHVATLLQLPMWISITFALRNFCFMAPRYDEVAFEVYKQLSTGGFGWVTNFTQPDPFYILPILVAVTNLINIEVQSMLVPEKYTTKTHRYFRNFSRGLMIILVPLISYMPSSVILYWLISSISANLQSILLLSPRIRRSLNIPRTETELKHPYSYLIKKIGEKLRLKQRSAAR